MSPALARRIAASIAAALDMPVAPLRWTPVGGGCIHQAWRFTTRARDAERDFFVKTNEESSAPLFAAERDGLDAMRQARCVDVPAAIAQAAGADAAWLALEWLELVPFADATAARLGEALAAQHAVAQPRFGWASDNFIGASPQPNGWSDDWLDFWRTRRLVPQMRMAAAHRLPARLIDRTERLAADCEALFRGHSPRPSLLHGDLWSGNASATAGGRAVAFDPAVYCGDREADLAMTELFGGFPAAFAAAYRERSPLAAGYPVRRDFYNVYHVLNHANLFAGGYVRDAQERIERLLAEVH